MCSQGHATPIRFHLCLHGECDTLQKGVLLGTCEVRPETGHTGSLTSSSSGLAYTFTESVLKSAEDDIDRFQDKDQSYGLVGGRRFHPYRWSDRLSQDQRSGKPAWKQLGRLNSKKKGGGQ